MLYLAQCCITITPSEEISSKDIEAKCKYGDQLYIVFESIEINFIHRSS